MPHQREVVITGLGVVCPLGVGRGPFWSALEAGQSGIRAVPEFVDLDVPFRIAGMIPGFEPKEYVQPRKTLKVMSGEIQAGYSAAVLAMQDAGLAKGSVDPERLGVVLGSELLYGELEEMREAYRHCVVEGEFHSELWAEHAMKDMFPLWMLKYLPNMAACHIGIAHDARGPNNSIVQGGASSLLAFIEATQAILRGHADVMITGGSGSTCSINAITFRRWDHLTKWTGAPQESPRPFDARRDGTVLAEGAGVLILESREHAQKRNAKILASVLGGGNRFEPPVAGQVRQGTAIAASIHATLNSAKIAADDLGFVSAAACGTVTGDALEAQAIRRTLGDVPVTAPKSYFGDLGAGSGAVELVASVLALAAGSVPPTLNFAQPDAACPINVLQGEMTKIEKRTAIALSQSDTGQAAAVALAAAS